MTSSRDGDGFNAYLQQHLESRFSKIHKTRDGDGSAQGNRGMAVQICRVDEIPFCMVHVAAHPLMAIGA